MPKSFQNFQNYQITFVNNPETGPEFIVKELFGQEISTPYFILDSFAKDSLDEISNLDSNEQVIYLNTYIEEQFAQITRYGVQVEKVSGITIVRFGQYGLAGGSPRAISFVLSAIGLGAGIYLSSIGFVPVGGGLISGALAGFMKAWEQKKESFDATLCAKKALVGFIGNFLSGGIFSYVDDGLIGAMLAGAISRASTLVLDAAITKEKMPTIQKVVEKALYGAIFGGMSSVAANKAAEYSEAVIAPLIEEGKGLIAKVLSQGVTGAIASAASSLVNTVCDNAIEKRPLTDNLVFNLLTAAGIGGSIASLKAIYAILEILTKLALLEIKRLQASLAIKEEFNSKMATTIVIDAQNKAGEGNRTAMADALTHQMARMRWGEEGATSPETQAARDLMHMTFMIDQGSKNVDAHYGRLCRSVSRFMEEIRGAWVSAELLDRFENNESQTPRVKTLLNSTTRESIWTQVFIEIVDRNFAKNGYKPLTPAQQQALTTELHRIAHNVRTKKQPEEFVKTARVITKENYEPKEEDNAIQSFYDAAAEAQALAEGRFKNASPNEIYEFPRNSSALTKMIKSVWNSLKNMGAGVGANTNGESATVTAGPAKQPDLFNVYTYKPNSQKPAPRQAGNKERPVQTIPMEVEPEVKNLSAPVAGVDYSNIASILTSAQGEKPQASSTPEAGSISTGKRRISTKKSVVIKGRDGRNRHHDSETGKFVPAPGKRMRTSQTSNTFSGSVSVQESGHSVSTEAVKELIAPRPVSGKSDITVGLTHKSEASASLKQEGLKFPKLTAGASSEVQILNGENMKVSASTATLGIEVSPNNISVGARFSLFSASKQFELAPKCDESGCTQTTVTVTGNLGSIGFKGGIGKQNLKNGATKTQIEAGAGGGLLGVTAHVEITHTEAQPKIEPPVMPVKM
ncbi:hypothetical protein ACFORL_03040 [Legionella dresdenensis]|uniref:Uncharacterized protein n=1 Tax=Legionella dresdenensis TaxID=450200 RepID=A0ABV8CCP3_9GAMM